MSRGVHFAITPEQRDRLLSFSTDEDREDYVKDVIEAAWDKEYLQETDKAWDPVHRCLTDHPPGAEELDPAAGKPPLNLCILGGRQVLDDEYHYIIRLIEPEQVAELANALDPLEEDWLTARYRIHCEGAWPEYGDEHCGYTWWYFNELKQFFRRMAPTGRAVIFAVSQ